MKQWACGMLLLLTTPVLAQTEIGEVDNLYQKDAELWTAVTVRYKVNKKLRLQFEEGFRIADNLGAFKTQYNDIGATYKVHKLLKVSGFYRLRIKSNATTHRFFGDVAVRVAKFDRFRVNYRLRLQNQFEPNGQSEAFVRNKIGISYNVKGLPLNPYFANEWFYQFRNIGNAFTRQRLTFGVGWDISKRKELSAFYRVQHDLNVANRVQGNILGVAFSYTIKSK